MPELDRGNHFIAEAVGGFLALMVQSVPLSDE